MEETVFPPSPNWFLPKILSTREDGSLVYGSKNNIVILKITSNQLFNTLLINNAHDLKVTSVAFSSLSCNESLQNTIASCSEDGFVKLWKLDTLSAIIGHRAHWEQKEICGKIICMDWSTVNPHHIVSAADNNSLVLWDILSNITFKFTFYKLVATTVACCPHNHKLVAVGVKSGLINIISLRGNGNIIHKLRGHDNEIQSLSWCPVPYNVFKIDELHEEFLLASACQDREIFIWRVGCDGKCEAKILIPTNCISKKDGAQIKLKNSFSFAAILWLNAYKLYISSNFGELLYFDIKSYLNQSPQSLESKLNKQLLNCFKVGHHYHGKGLFAIASTPYAGDILLHENISVKSELKFEIEANRGNIKNIDCVDGDCTKFKWEVNPSSLSPLIWTVGQDRKLIACKFLDHKFDIVFNLHTLSGNVYSAVSSPHDPNKIAIAAGDSVLRLWNLSLPSTEIQMYWQKIKDKVMTLAWHPTKDGILAYGTSEGRVGLIDTNSNKLPKLFKPSHSHAIYNLSWGPEVISKNESISKKDFNLYCIGDNILSVYDCSKINEEPLNLSKLLPFQCKKQTDVSWKPDFSVMAVGSDDGSISLVEPSEFKIIYTLLAYKKMIWSIAWHPPSTTSDLGLSPFHSYFTSGSTDNNNEIRIFNYKQKKNGVKVEQVAVLKGHFGHIITVAWNPHLGGRLVSISNDRTVQVWDVPCQTPLVNYSPIEMPMFSMWCPIDPDIIFTGCRNGVFCVWKISAQTRIAPINLQKTKTKKPKKDKGQLLSLLNGTCEESSAALSINKESEPANIQLAEAKIIGKNIKEIKMFSKAWGDDTSSVFNLLYSFLKENNTENNEFHFSLPFLCQDDKYKELVSREEESLKKGNNWTEYYELVLWNGRIKEVIEEKMKTGQLNDFLISLAPTVSPRLWQDACLAYSKSLVEKKLFRKAATYLMVCHKIYEAIKLLADENMFLEALCIARSRLPKSDPIISTTIRQYAQWLFKNGSFLKACECYIYLEDYLEVAKICGKKNSPEYLILAALAARKCGFEELEVLEAGNALLKCFECNNLDLGQKICDDHSNLKHLEVFYKCYVTLQKLDSNQMLLDENIVCHIKRLVPIEEVAFPENMNLLYQKYAHYKYRREVLIIVAQELSLAACAPNTDIMFTHVIRSLSTCCRYIKNSDNEEELLFKLCTWLSPSGLLSNNSYFTLRDSSFQSKKSSLREFLSAAVVKNLNSDPSPANISDWISVIYELKDSFLDENSFKYFKNLLEVEMCEKRLMTNQNILAKNRFSTVKESNKVNSFHTSAISTNQDQEVSLTEENTYFTGVKISCESSTNSSTLEASKNLDSGSQRIAALENGAGNNGNDIGEVSSSIEHENLDKSSINIENSASQSGAELEEKLVKDRNLLDSLNFEISSFEATKISSPNPVPVFFMLKNICLKVPKSQVAQNVLEYIEKKWEDLSN